MAKIQRLSELQYQLPVFSTIDNFDLFYQGFLQTDLGKIYLGLPFKSLSETFNLKSHKKGTRSYFSNEGKIGLMFLKNYTI